MRRLLAPVLMTLAMIACGGVDDAPLGGPYGGTTDPTDPNGGQNGDNGNNNNNNTNTGTDAGSTNTTQDSGSTTTKDSGTTTTKDSGTTTTQDSGSTQTTAPTWTAIFNSYLAGSSSTTSKGHCAGCHSQGSSKSNLYSWLQGKGYISGKNSPLVDPNQSCLSWYGGNMPTNGPSSYSAAVTDMNAWAAAGALNN